MIAQTSVEDTPAVCKLCDYGNETGRMQQAQWCAQYVKANVTSKCREVPAKTRFCPAGSDRETDRLPLRPRKLFDCKQSKARLSSIAWFKNGDSITRDFVVSRRLGAKTTMHLIPLDIKRLILYSLCNCPAQDRNAVPACLAVWQICHSSTLR